MIDQIQQQILTHLPAWEAHQRMAPPIRKPMPKIPKRVRYSAVCVLLFYKKNKLHTLLIKRAEDGKSHSGQIAFPGGKLDPNDFSMTYCALRECEEEIGLSQEKINVLGGLSSLYIPPSNFIVTPIVCKVSEIENLVPSPDEVAEIMEVPLDILFDPSSKDIQEVWRSDDASRSMKTPVYTFGNHTIWGATAMMLSELEEIYKRVL
jgi:8-oxo-dGTP pyrophosphatase MutT (NUDIX family)